MFQERRDLSMGYGGTLALLKFVPTVLIGGGVDNLPISHNNSMETTSAL